MKLSKIWHILCAHALLLSCHGLQAQTIGPKTIVESNITVKVKHEGTMPTALGPSFTGDSLAPNVASPVAAGYSLYFIDQNDGIYRRKFFWDNEEKHEKIFDVENAPEGLTLNSRQSVINVAPGFFSRSMYVMFTSATLPKEDIPLYPLPKPLPDVCCLVDKPIAIADIYRVGKVPEPLNFLGATSTVYQVLYEFRLKREKLVKPRAVAAFEMQSGSIVHSGGGMLALPDGRLLFARGDGITLGADGRFAPQDPEETVGKILLINPWDGSIEVAAMGVRNVQRMQFTYGNYSYYDLGVTFADIGGVTAEEINYIPLWDLLDTYTVENFGWGRHADGKAREGTFYISPGVPIALNLEGGRQSEPPVESKAPSPEAGFIQPLAQWGRDDKNGGIAASGPVVSPHSFNKIRAMFTDLGTGAPLAVIDSLTETDANVYRVKLVNEKGEALESFNSLIGRRADARMFTFPDGRAGVILEATGDYYSLTEQEAQ